MLCAVNRSPYFSTISCLVSTPKSATISHTTSSTRAIRSVLASYIYLFVSVQKRCTNGASPLCRGDGLLDVAMLSAYFCLSAHSGEGGSGIIGVSYILGGCVSCTVRGCFLPSSTDHVRCVEIRYRTYALLMYVTAPSSPRARASAIMGRFRAYTIRIEHGPSNARTGALLQGLRAVHRGFISPALGRVERAQAKLADRHSAAHTSRQSAPYHASTWACRSLIDCQN